MSIAKAIVVAVVAACTLALSAEPNTQAAQANVVTAKASHTTVTKIKMNGRFAFVNLVDGDTLGYVNVSRDQIANTSALDFGYASPDPTDPTFFIFIQGAGAIPNGAFTITATSAHLLVTTPFPATRCVVNRETLESTCAPTASTFDLTWTSSGIDSVYEKTKRIETIGPITTRFEGEFVLLGATVTGTWDGHTATEMSGNLADTRSKTIIREITMTTSP
jgi:hypothetical protein